MDRPGVGMSGEILFLCHRIPFPPDRGDKIRSYHLLKALARLAPVHVATFAENNADFEAESGLAEIATSHYLVQRDLSNVRAGIAAITQKKPVSLTAFENQGIYEFVARIIQERNIETIFVFSGQMAQYVPADWAGRLIMDFVDVDSAKFASYANQSGFPMAWMYRREERLLRAFEAQIAHIADISTLVSGAEAQLFRKRINNPNARIVALGNGIDTVFYDPEKMAQMDNPFAGYSGTKQNLVFTGQMDYPPNIEAVSSFAQEVLPHIREQFPDATFHIVGRNPTKTVTALNQINGVHVHGPVSEILPYLGYADVIVAPLRTARGIQNKVLEAMAMARPVVVSSAAAEGIDAIHDRHFLVAATPDEEARAVCEFLSDPLKSRACGEQARAHMIARYGWDAQLALLSDWLGMDSLQSPVDQTLASEAI